MNASMTQERNALHQRLWELDLALTQLRDQNTALVRERTAAQVCWRKEGT